MERSGGSFFDVLIKYIPLPRYIPRFADGVLDLFECQVVDRSRRGDDVLFDHQAAHVVGAEEERRLADLGALRDPRRLDVADVVEVEPGNRLRAQILERAV